MPGTKTWPENVGRFKELVLYISQKCANDPKFDTVKLNKLLFFSDFLAYAVFGEPITGFAYQKLERGPGPERMPQIRREMVTSQDLGIQELPLTPNRRTVNLRRPNLTVFSADQISLVDNLIETLKGHDSKTASDITHTMPCWKIPDLYDTIPYETVFLSHEALTDVDAERGRAVARELGLTVAQQTS